MKLSLALGPRRPLSRRTAWGCLTSNLALPGLGSLMAGRLSGYFQLLLALAGLALTLVFGGHLFYWALNNWSQLYGPQADPLEALLELWLHVRWALLGLGVFGCGWLWALVTSRLILNQAEPPPSREAPPRLD